MMTACEHCGARITSRTHCNTIHEPTQFVETYACGARIRWGHKSATLERCPHATGPGQTDEPEQPIQRGQNAADVHASGVAARPFRRTLNVTDTETTP